MTTEDARERDQERALSFGEAGTTVVPDPATDPDDTPGTPGDTPADTPDDTPDDTTDTPGDMPDDTTGTPGDTPTSPDGPGDDTGPGSDTPSDPETPGTTSDDGRDFSDMELEDLYDPDTDDETPDDGRDLSSMELEDLYDPEDPEDEPATGPDAAGTEADPEGRDLSGMDLEELYDPETEEPAAHGPDTGPVEEGVDAEGPGETSETDRPSPVMTEFDPDTATAPIGATGTADEQDGEGGTLADAAGEQDAYLDALAGATRQILTGESPFEGWQFTAGRAVDAAHDYATALEAALGGDHAPHDAAAETADAAAERFGVGAYSPDDFTPVDLGLDRGSVFGRVMYAFQQEFSAEGGMETVFEGDEDGTTVIETVGTKITNHTNWAAGGHAEAVDAASLADLYRVAKDEKGLAKVADAAMNRGMLHGEVRSQAYVDKAASMEKLATFTVQEVETGLAELDATVATTDYSGDWVVSGDTDLDTYVNAAVDAVKDGFRTVMATARIWNEQEQALADDPSKKQQYDDASAFFPGDNHAQQNREAFYDLAAEGVSMMQAGREALESGILDAVDAELGKWERLFEEQEVGALLDHTDRSYGALDAAHDAYTDAKASIEDVAGTLDSVLSYTGTDGSRAVDAVDAIDTATDYLTDLGASVVDEMAPDGVIDGRYGHADVGEAMKDDYLPSFTPQGRQEKRDDLNTALQTFAEYVAR